MTQAEVDPKFHLPEEARDFAQEEYKSLREEQLMRVKEMDVLLFRTIGVCTLIYSLTFVDLSAVLESQGTDGPDIDGRILRYLVFIPVVVIALAWADYWRRLFTLILCGQYLARLEAAIYAPDAKHVHKLISEKTATPPSFWDVFKGAPELEGAVEAEVNATLGYDIFYISKNRFARAGQVRHGIWFLMLLGSIGLVWVQFGWLAPDETPPQPAANIESSEEQKQTETPQ